MNITLHIRNAYIFGNKKTLPLAKKLIFFAVISLLMSCKEFVSIDLSITQIASEKVYNSDADARAAILGIYTRMFSSQGVASGGDGSSITHLGGLSSDELINYRTTQPTVEFSNSALTANNSAINTVWSEFYQYIYTANHAIEHLSNSTGITPTIREQLIGQAKFVRAFAYFYLVNLYGNVPLVTTTDYRVNSILPRSPVDEVYQLIIQNLQDAREMLSADYSFSNDERAAPNRWVATALLARVSLYMGRFEDAEQYASELIAGNPLFSLEPDLNKVFLLNSSEAIWQLRPTFGGTNTLDANLFVLVTTPSQVSLNDHLLDVFAEGDLRRDHWIGSIQTDKTYYYPYKYKVRSSSVSTSPVTEATTIFRLAEQYFIRAEARAQQNDITGAQVDLNAIRNRAALPNTSAGDKEALLTAIEQERVAELFTEWGHRWFDLKRTNRIDAVLSEKKGERWQSTDALYPIPFREILNNRNLDQNIGY